VGGVPVAPGDSGAQHGQGLLAVELGLLLPPPGVRRGVVFDEGDAQRQATGGVVGIARGVPAQVAQGLRRAHGGGPVLQPGAAGDQVTTSRA
jgi:hypothetical protein